VKVSVDERDAGTIIKLSGQISIGAGVQDLRVALARLSSPPAPRVVVDMEGVTFVDSAGLGELVAAYHRTWERGGRLCLARPRAKVRDLIRLTRLDELIPIHDGLDEALRDVAENHSSSSV
jgi:anti-sigma B factor antagonist